MKDQDIQNLLKRFQEGECTPDEEEQLKLWYNSENSLSDWTQETDENLIELELKNRIDAQIDHFTVALKHPWYKFAAAAILLCVLGVGLYFYKEQKEVKLHPDQYVTADIEPGNNKAILTLADGSKISLTDARNGQIASESGITITKSADGQLVYTINPADADLIKSAGGASRDQMAYNTISTPAGGQHQINLPDGTRVWLNSESSLKFPVSFSDPKEREVHLRGEAYFEVSENKSKPFRVLSKDQVVEVLGTHFNVMAYLNEKALETTLLEGKVSVQAGNSEVVITQGQQVRLREGQIRVVKDADVDGVVAWKNNLFQFDNTEIDQVMRQIERWYDVDIEYQNGIPDVHFTGVVPRDLKVSIILKAMEQTSQVKFKIEGRKITVIKNKNKN